ncbi:MAG: hypothetical protein ABGY29_09805, partial [bacterium]
SGLVLVGGGSLLHKLPEAIEDYLGLPVRMGDDPPDEDYLGLPVRMGGAPPDLLKQGAAPPEEEM